MWATHMSEGESDTRLPPETAGRGRRPSLLDPHDPSFSLKSECCLSVCSTAGCHRFPLDTHWIVILLQARSEVRAGQGRTQKAGHVTTVPVVFAELRPGLRHGDKDDPTLPLPMAPLCGPIFSTPCPTHSLSVFDTQVTASRKPLFFLSLCPFLVFYTWFPHRTITCL